MFHVHTLDEHNAESYSVYLLRYLPTHVQLDACTFHTSFQSPRKYYQCCNTEAANH